MKTFGIRTDGLAEHFEKIFKDYFSSYTGNSFTYLEIGAAGCQSMKSFYEIIKENFSGKIQVDGLDLVQGWSLDWSHIGAYGYALSIYKNGTLDNAQPNAESSLYLEDDPRGWIKNHYEDESLDICFIDGCHGSKCVRLDFEVVAPKIKKSGIVFFHDSGEAEQGTDWQGHCGENINVRKAILDLGLNGENKDWEFIADIAGSRTRGSDGNGIWIVKKK